MLLKAGLVKDEKYAALEAELKRCRGVTLVPPGEPQFVHILTSEVADEDKRRVQVKLDEVIAAAEARDARIAELESERECDRFRRVYICLTCSQFKVSLWNATARFSELMACRRS